MTIRLRVGWEVIITIVTGILHICIRTVYARMQWGGQTDNSSAGNSSTAAAEAPSITYDLMNSYSRVFDPDYYYNTYPDLQTAIGTDKLALFTHFYNSGMAEGRKGCAEFDVNVYKENNTDLQTAFGSDLRKYYEHYMNTGWAEGRTH